MMTFRDQSAPAHHGPLVETLTRLCGDSKISKQMIKTVCSHSIYASKTSYIENSDREIATLECMMANLVEQKEPDVPGMLIATLGILTGSMLEKEDNEAPKLGKGEMLTKSTSKKLDAVEDIPGLTVGSILSLLEPLEESQGPFGLDPTILDYLGTAAAAHEERIEVQKSRLQHVPLVAFTDAGDEAGTGISSAAFDRILSAVTAAEVEEDNLSLDGALRLAQAAHMDSSESDDSDFEEPQVEQEDSSDSESEEEVNINEDHDLLRQALALSLTGRSFDEDFDEQKEEDIVQPQMPELEDAESKGHAVADYDEVDLPPLPEPLHYYPYSLLQEEENEDITSYVDPSSHAKFGYIPASHAMVHTFRNAMSIILKTRATISSETQEMPSIPGGMGLSLFISHAEVTKPKRNDLSGCALTIQLLVITLLLMSENRNLAIEGLKQAILEEQHYVEEKEEPLSDEEDDPLAIRAVASVASLTECLATKGMRRKAAAAAHDAANRLKSLRKKTDAWKDRLKLYSHCTLLSLRCLKHFLQGIVLTWLQAGGLSVVDIHEILPSSVWSKLSACLATLVSVQLTRSFATMTSGDDSNELEDFLMPFRIYKEAVVAWGECVPFLYPSRTSRSEALKSLIVECFEVVPSGAAIESLLTMPSTEMDAKMHRLQTLCKRLCVTDLMNGFVDRPISFTIDDSNVEKEVKEDPVRASPLVKLLASSCLVLHDAGYLRNFHLALCHRLNLRGLLWDGLYLVSHIETEDASSPSPASTASTTDAIRVVQTPSNSLVFDSLKCSDSIAILSNQSHGEGSSPVNGSSAHQRASKVWGTVLSSLHFSPNTGVHRWAVRLDKCERGHVFVGVATGQASTRTYVGGDKNGWGVIGTQALWHDRRKIRGDYGATFRTGSIIIITLDTDVGTLSFSSWKDSTGPSSAFSLDPLLPSPRRQSQSSCGTVEEWGVAFEGLPIDSKLFPAVGLYQRDDRVTLLHVDSGSRSISNDYLVNETSIGASCYFPHHLDAAVYNDHLLSKFMSVKQHNSLLAMDILQYAIDTLHESSSSIEANVSAVLPSIAASLCLLPSSIPVLSERLALVLLPHVTKCIKSFEHHKGDTILFKEGLVEGKWVIRATGSSGSSTSMDCEEYVVDLTSVSDEHNFSIGFQGCGIGTTGKSKNGLVKIAGAVHGSSVHFEEEWTDVSDECNSSADETASSCLVNARLSLDGRKFEGTYRNIQYGTSGHIAGILTSSKPETNEISAILCQALLCLAHGHLLSIVSEDRAGDIESMGGHDSPSNITKTLGIQRRGRLDEQLASHLLSYGFVDGDHVQLKNAIQDLKSFYSYRELQCEKPYHECAIVYPHLLDTDPFVKKEKQQTQASGVLLQEVISMDDDVAALNGGKGSLAIICPVEYLNARQHLIACFLRHLHFDGERQCDYLGMVWKTALKTMDDGLRATLAFDDGTSRHDRALAFCDHTMEMCLFLMQIEPNPEISIAPEDTMAEIVSFCTVIIGKSDLDYLMSRMRVAITRSCLRGIAFQQVKSIIHHCSTETHDTSTRHILVDCIAASAPRLLGRAFSPSDRSKNRRHGDNDLLSSNDLGSYFLSGLSGAGLAALDGIRESVYFLLGQFILVTKEIGDHAYNASTESLLLSSLACFMMSFRAVDIRSIAEESGILSILPVVLSRHQKSLALANLFTDEGAESNLVPFLQEVTKDNVARALLCAAVTVAHSFSFQVAQNVKDPDSVVASQKCEMILLEELRQTIPFLEKSIKNSLVRFREEQSEEQYLKWLETCRPESDLKTSNLLIMKRTTSAKNSSVGMSIFGQSGSFAAPFISQAKAVKPSKSSICQARSTSITFSSRGDDLLALMGNPAQQHLSHLLHVLSCLITSPSFPYLFSDSAWFVLLLEAAGLQSDIPSVIDEFSCGTGSSNQLLPGRYRARILRLCEPLLSRSVPDIKVIRGLLMIAGNSSPMMSHNIDDDDALVSSEALSLLRSLHAENQVGWQTAIQKEIKIKFDNCSEPWISDPSVVGTVLFLSGKIETIRRGSYVLLKPAAAAFLSLDGQSPPSNKLHGNTFPSGTSGSNAIAPHHVVGNGTEGIVSGLCRADASAGIVSDVDMHTGVCEIILMERHRQNRIEDVTTLGNSKEGKGSNMSRATLTVRALRTPLSVVAQAEEMPLYLDNSFPTDGFFTKLLPAAIRKVDHSISNNSKVMKNEVSDITDASNGFALLVLRACIVLLSDERILLGFLEREDSRTTLSQLLRLACMNKGLTNEYQAYQPEFLSSLSSLEAKFSHISAMLSEIGIRKVMLEGTSDLSWSRIHEEYIALISNTKDTKSENEPAGVGASINSGSSTEPIPFPAEVETSTGSRMNAAPLGRTGNLSSFSSNSTEDADDNEAAATAAAHHREAAIAQMAELGLPRSWSELALRRTGGTNIETAVNFCLERGGDMERLLIEERERERVLQRQSSSSVSRRRSTRNDSNSANHLLRQLLEMGFPNRWCTEALIATRNNVDEALTWILANGERLSAEDEGMEEETSEADEDQDDSIEEESGEEDVDEDVEDTPTPEGESSPANDSSLLTNDASAPSVEESCSLIGADDGQVDCTLSMELEPTMNVGPADPSQKDINPSAQLVVLKDDTNCEKGGWAGLVTPLRFISGRSIIDPQTLAISGLPTGGFSSVGTKGVLLTSGKWYYEAILETAGCLQIGWADGSFAGHCHADRGDGCGDGPSSWAYDGWRRYRWHAIATEWGCRWKEGDVVGCLVDMDEHRVSFTLNGLGEEIGMGVAFSGNGFRPCGGVYACVSFNRREKLRLIIGGDGTESFKYTPPPGYHGVGEALQAAVKERRELIKKESVLNLRLAFEPEDSGSSSRFLCDFSDGEHGHELFAWQHRYYGSDASVHLGSGRSSRQSGAVKGSSTHSKNGELCVVESVSSRLEKMWSNSKLAADMRIESINFAKSAMVDGYDGMVKSLCSTMTDVHASLGVLYSRKLVLHLIIVLGERFDLRAFLSLDSEPPSESDELCTALQLWEVLDACVSLRAAGWVGEAGAMAVAAEALGLGISTNDHQHGRHYTATDEHSPFSSSNADEQFVVPAAGLAQLLTTVVLSKECKSSPSLRYTGRSLAASAEAAIGADGGGGPLVFLQRGLQSAACKSRPFCEVLVAVVRRSVRQLAVIDYSGDDLAQLEGTEDDEMDNSIGAFNKSKTETRDDNDQDTSLQPDARLASFLTGLLLSNPVQASVPDKVWLTGSLLEAWSIGLLSASAPWRMVCALTASGILNMAPTALVCATSAIPALERFYSRLPGTVARRIWAERAAVPVCSRYVQSLVELLASARRAIAVSSPTASFLRTWESFEVDAAMPIPFDKPSMLSFEIPGNAFIEEANCVSNWEWSDGWLSNDTGWEVWSGVAEFVAVDWKPPSRSAVRTLMDGGEGPPMLREGCTVMRGLDWDDDKNDDDKIQYEVEKTEREKEKKSQEEYASNDIDPASSSQPVPDDDQDPVADIISQEGREDSMAASEGKEHAISHKDVQCTPVKKKKRKKLPNPKLPTGTVLAIEEWDGVPAMARRVRWDRTGKEGIYRYGGDGGRYDICHVEVNEKFTRLRKKHPLPESAEQCASRHGFGVAKKYCILLRLRELDKDSANNMTRRRRREGVLEWPDFGAGVRVECILNADNSVTIEEKELLYGSKDAGWEARFGQPSFVPNTTTVVIPSARSINTQNQAEADAKSSFISMYEELFGSSCHDVALLRHRASGDRVRVICTMRLLRGRRSRQDGAPFTPSTCPPPIRFDRDFHATSLSLSRDGRTVTCVSPDGRGTAFASTGFTKGVHYWEVKLEQADIGSVFIGVAEKPSGSGSGSTFGNDSPPRLNRWIGWGLVNFRATYTSGAERVYGAHCHTDDTVGVLLDCDTGRISFFYDGLKYGEHILNDLGCAFENVSPFGFNADGCGSGGAGQGAPSAVEGGRGGRYPAHGAVRPRSLWPVIGLRNPGDRATFSTKWMTSLGVDSSITLKNILAVDEVLSRYDLKIKNGHGFPEWFVRESFQEFKRWECGRWFRTETRASGPHRLSSFGLDVEVDTSPLACAVACAGLGLRRALLHGDRVVVKRSAGRILELSEEAIILGAYQGRLYYQIVSQKSEGGSLTEGGGRAWFWDESEAVDDSLQLVGRGQGFDIDLPLIDRFTCLSKGGLRIVYEGGAVVRSDIEIFDRSQNIGSISHGVVIPQDDVLERRVNSCGVVRYRVRYDGVGEGWISSRIRGGKEEPIIEPVRGDALEIETESRFPTPMCAAQAWYETFKRATLSDSGIPNDQSEYKQQFSIKDLDEFKGLISDLPKDTSSAQLDQVISSLVGIIADFSESGDAVECSFAETTMVVSYALSSIHNKRLDAQIEGNPQANEAAAAFLVTHNVTLSARVIVARMAILRAFNRRIRLALPWLTVRPSQEGSAILGGLCGHGALAERAGRQKISKSTELWVQVPSIASRIRDHRGLVFGSVKRLLLDSITFATTTPTPLSHDEYELPREIRTVRVNRLKAKRAMAGSDNLIKRKHSVFSQLQNETRSWGGAALRRGFVAKGHGGQKRAFKVKLIGEGVNDYSGPYREVFTDAMHDVMEFDEAGRGIVGVLDPTPNKAAQLGDNRDLYMFAWGDGDLRSYDEGWRSEEELRIRRSFAILTTSCDEASREIGESLAFLGRLVGTACRHGIPVDLPLPMNAVWKAIVEEKTDEIESLREMDLLASRQFTNSLDSPPLLWWQRRMLNSFVDGMSNVLPVEILTLLSGEELRDIICGNPDVDVDLLKRVVEYEGYEKNDPVIGFFWESLREMTGDERKKFLQFVWARSRLPNKESDFEAPFKIMKGTEKTSDESLPSASTCFFSLTLPCYSSKEILKRKLLFAIENVCTMESDYVTNDAEIGEGWRGL